MNEKHSLLSNIRSKYILKDILILAFRNMKSVLKFLAYNKALLDKLDINFKDYYDYNTEIKNDGSCLFVGQIFEIFVYFIPLLIYDIMFYAKGTFNNNNLKEGYDKKKKNYVDDMDNYVLISYLSFQIISHLLLFMLFCRKMNKKVLKRKVRFIIGLIKFFIKIFYYIAFIIKFCFTKKIIQRTLKNEIGFEKEYEPIWFYDFDDALLAFFSLDLLINFIVVCCEYDVSDIYILNKINGINIYDFKLPNEYDKLNKIGKIAMIFKKENMKKYFLYGLDDTQKTLINNINQLRRKNNIPELEYNEKQYLPDYIINKKTEFIFYEKENIYKFYNDYYLIKYPISECQKIINDNNITNILSINILDRINIIRKDDYEYIALYNNQFNENENNNNNQRENRNINIRNININIPSINNIANTEDRLNENEQSVNLSVTRVNDIDNDGNMIIRNMKINDNPFKK